MTSKAKSNSVKNDRKTSVKKINKEEIKIIKDIIKQFSEDPKSCEFREPVNYQALGLMDYPEIIKKPMDLKTLEENLTTGKYNTILAALNDLNLIWKNCQDYNHEDSVISLLIKEISELATEFSKKTKKLIRKHFPDLMNNLYPKSKPSKKEEMTNEKKISSEGNKG